jgi:cell wall-associated NlpC family hydrolase
LYRIKTPRCSIGSADIKTRQAIIEAARSYVGVRFMHSGRNRAGLDCVGLLIASYADVTGISVTIDGYSDWPCTMIMRKFLNQVMMPIRRHELGPGDAVFLRSGSRVHHLGIFTGNTLIHASNEIGLKRVVEVGVGPDDMAHVMGCYRFPQYEGAI